MSDNNSWGEWSKLVLSELDRLNKSNQELAKEIQDFKIDITAQLARKSEVDELRRQLADQKIEMLNDSAKNKADAVSTLNDAVRTFSADIQKLDNRHSVQLAQLKTELQLKAGVWGAIAGIIPAVISLVLIMLKAYMS